MNYIFNKLKIINFLSFEYAEINLNDNGFVLVEGKNIDSIDNATSNGSGKSTIFNALCWVLTGRTCTGNNSNIKRLRSESDTSVSLEFLCDNKECIIKRTIQNKGGKQLEIIIDGDNKTNKGIRNSEEILLEFFPEFTFEFVSNSFIFGQGLPCKITNFWQGKRKEILESLTGINQIIETFKSNLNIRKQQLSDRIKEVSDNILVEKTSLDFNKGKLLELELKNKKSFEFDLEKTKLELNAIEQQIEITNTDIENIKAIISNKTVELNSTKSQIDAEKSNFKLEYIKEITPLTNKITEYRIKGEALSTKIKQNSQIKDTCPTCHQKIVGIIKNDMTKEKEELNAILEEYKKLDRLIIEIKNKYKDALNTKIEIFESKVQDLKNKIESQQRYVAFKVNDLNLLNIQKQEKMKLLTSAEIYFNEYDKLQHEIEETKEMIEDFNKQIEENEILKESLIKHQLINTKMISFCKREFRGLILTQILSYLDIKIKDYCNLAFNHNDISIYLSGNNIEITYQNKSYDNLSGGEKQKVDILLQLSIKDLLLRMKNFSSNLLIFDEVFDNLDTASANSLLTLFLNVSNTVSSFYLITHRTSELEIPNDYIWTVTKSNNISQLVVN